MTNAERNAAMEAAYRDGLTLGEIADEHHLTRERVRQVLHRRNVPMRNPQESLRRHIERGFVPKGGGGRLPPDEERNLAIILLYLDGFTYSQIAREMKLASRMVVAGVIKRWRQNTGAEKRGLTDKGREAIRAGCGGRKRDMEKWRASVARTWRLKRLLARLEKIEAEMERAA